MQSIVQTLGTTSISKLQNQLLPCEMSNMTASGTMLLGSVSKIFRRDSVHRCSLHTRFMPRLEKPISGIGEQVRSVEFRRPMWCYGRWLNILSFFWSPVNFAWRSWCLALTQKLRTKLYTSSWIMHISFPFAQNQWHPVTKATSVPSAVNEAHAQNRTNTHAHTIHNHMQLQPVRLQRCQVCSQSPRRPLFCRQSWHPEEKTKWSFPAPGLSLSLIYIYTYTCLSLSLSLSVCICLGFNTLLH